MPLRRNITAFKKYSSPRWVPSFDCAQLRFRWVACPSASSGFLRKEVVKSIYSFLDCGIPENGVARIRCDICGHDFFVAFSCRCGVVCPSCSTKRSLLFGEKVTEIAKPLPHLHITFTIPKILTHISGFKLSHNSQIARAFFQNLDMLCPIVEPYPRIQKLFDRFYF